MSTPNSPIPHSPEPAPLAYPPSLPALMVLPPLQDQIEDPPTPLPLGEYLSNPTPEEVPVPESPPPFTTTRPQTPEGYTCYNPNDPNHVKYVTRIHLHREPYDAPQLPHYVKFTHNLGLNQHYVHGLMNNTTPPTTPYGWLLEAAPFTDPIPHLDTSVNNEALGIFDACYTKITEVDASLYVVHNYRVLANVDKYCALMLDYEDLLAGQAKVAQDLQDWRQQIHPI